MDLPIVMHCERGECMNRTIVISDIHGCLDAFDQLLDTVSFNSTIDQLILLGDYVDRGPNSRNVVERVMGLVESHHAIALRGNHDQRLVDLVRNGNPSVQSKFLEHGGIQTLMSYCGWIKGEVTDEILLQATSEITATYEHHIHFLSSLPLYYEDDHHIYVHAGLNPRYANWKEQPDHDFMYIKGEFYQTSTRVEKKVIFGHTRTIELHGSSDIWYGDDKIGIDGGCAYGQQLNALILQQGAYSTAYSKNSVLQS